MFFNVAEMKLVLPLEEIVCDCGKENMMLIFFCGWKDDCWLNCALVSCMVPTCSALSVGYIYTEEYLQKYYPWVGVVFGLTDSMEYSFQHS